MPHTPNTSVCTPTNQGHSPTEQPQIPQIRKWHCCDRAMQFTRSQPEFAGSAAAFLVQHNPRLHAALGCHISLFPANILNGSIVFPCLSWPWQFIKTKDNLIGFFWCFLMPRLRPCLLAGKPQAQGCARSPQRIPSQVRMSTPHTMRVGPLLSVWSLGCLLDFYWKLTVFPFVVDK